MRGCRAKFGAVKLDEFIENCSHAGKLESEGSFSVDSVAAFRKTLASALPEPHFYLFQLLQGLLKAGCRDIKVAVGRRENRITFRDHTGALADLEALAGEFKKGLSVASSDPLDLIMSGLVTALGCHISSAEFYYGKQRIQVDVNGMTHEQTSTAAQEPYILLRRSLEKGLSYSWSRIWGARKEEFRIRKAFEHSPVPILIAGLPTKPRARWRRTFEGEDLFALVEAVVVATDHPNHIGELEPEPEALDGSNLHIGACAKKSVGCESAVAPSLTLIALNASGEQLQGSLSVDTWNKRRWTICLTNRNNSLAEVEWIRNGLTISHQQIDLGRPGLHLVAPADDLEVDASGYELVENQAYEKALEEARGYLKKIEASLDGTALRGALKNLERDPEEVLESFPYLSL